MMNFDDLINEQRETVEWIKKVSEKFTKEPKARRTQSFIQERLDDLEYHWMEFKSRDEAIRSHKDYNEEHLYVKTKYFEQVRDTMTSIKDKLETKKKEYYEEKKTAHTAKECRVENDQKKRLKRQEAQKQALFRSIERIQKDEQKSKGYFTQKMNLINNLWEIIVKTHNDIIENAEDDETCEDIINDHEDVEQLYENTMIKLQEENDKISKQGDATNREVSFATHDEVKLPSIKLQTFGGDYKQWKSFIDLFEQTIHKNEKLGNAQKLHYLKTNLTGEAAKVIQHLQIRDSNYHIAREMLIGRYENTRLLVNAEIEALLNQRESSSESAEHLKRLHDTTTERVNALKGLNIDTRNWDPIIVHVVCQKLDNETRKAYEQSLSNPKELQSLDAFLKFLENKFHALENLERRQKEDKPQKQNSMQRFSNREVKRPFNRSYHTTTTPYCKLCRGQHWLHVCSKFINMPITQRQETVRKEKLCRNCFKPDHEAAGCFSYKSCQICKQKHHTLLHCGERQSNFAESIESTVLLATAIIKTNSKGNDFYLRALVDQGSQSSFITEDAVQRLQLQKKKASVSVTGLGSNKTGTATSKVEIPIKSIHESSFQTWATLLVLPRLTKVQPSKTFIKTKWEHIEHLSLADPSFYKAAAIDILIGADVFQNIILNGVIKGKPGSPLAQNTQLGWILSGTINPTYKDNVNPTTCHVTNCELDEQLKRFWEAEELEEENPWSQEETQCEKIFTETFKRDESGRYIVRLPFKEETKRLGESRNRALARFLQTEKKLVRNNQLQKEYSAFLKEYLELGHMELVHPTNKPEHEVYYLPHQAVIRPESSTTKLRVVFDASSKTNTGVSLNDKMLTGPVIQQDLFSIVTRWRKHKYVFRADIEKMYRQIQIAHQDRDYQRILWREKPTEKIQEFRLKTVTYGTSSAPFLATRTLQQLAFDEKDNFEIASKITFNDFYMDDLLSGEDTLESAIEAQNQLTALMASGGFKLRKWSSNTEAIMRKISVEDQEQGKSKISQYDAVKTLGIYWRPETDSFEFKINLQSKGESPTKRRIVSESARLFDPLGWLTPVVVKAKLLQQELWKAEISWDEALPEEMADSWNDFKNQLKSLEEIQIPRWCNYERKHCIELHGFCDASEKAFAAVIFKRVKNEDGEISTHLLCAKSKVAPIKKVSIPRLELCGALLLAKLMKKTKTALQINDLEVHAWTDSRITLAWLNGNPGKWKNYVSNRVVKILKLIDSSKWHHVKGSDNPADCASRGVQPSQLKAHNLWWNGPDWLSKNIIYQDNSEFQTNLEEKPNKMCALMTTEDESKNLIEELTERFSSITRLTRVLAYCRRFLNNIKVQKQNRRSGSLTSDEIEIAMKIIIKNVQEVSFPAEIKSLRSGKNVENQSNLRRLTPFIDKEGLLRVTGRLIESDLHDLQKHPFIIPHNSKLTILLIDDAHKSTLHGGNELTHSYLRQRYWIINGRSAIKKRLHECTICFRHKANRSNQLMGNLPKPRITRSRPFLHTGVDYAGPIDIRMSKGRGNKSYKGYIAIFICLATKAIHIELVSDLTANAFIAAFKRLCGRRGHVAYLYSDNGTNFVSANKILQQNTIAEEKYNEKVCNMLTACKTEWHFIPPGAPHFGGLWEAGVKSIKHHLKRTIGEHKLTFEELSTLLVQIEACLNSRPLYPLSNDPNDPDAITAGHFLIGSALLAPPEKHRLNEKECLLTRWQLLERMQQHFWKMWSQNYLSTLQQRQKWTKKTKNLQIGNIVLIKDENLPPSRWLLGIIDETHTGNDGLVRVVAIRAKNKIYKRPITKVCLLPIVDNYEREGKTSTNLLGRLEEIDKNNDANISETDESSKTTKRQMTNKNKQMEFVTTFLMLLLLAGRNVSALNNNKHGAQITPFTNHPGIYFEKIAQANLITSDWKLIVFYDLKNYWQEIRGLEDLINGMNSYCKKKGPDMRLRRENHCFNLVNQFNHQLAVIKNNNILLFNQGEENTKRRKRSPFDFVGTVANKLFGILDKEFADQYEDDIEHLKTNDNHLLGLIKNQTLIAETTINVIRKDEETVTQQLNLFQNHLELLSTNVKAVNEENAAAQSFLTLASYAILAMLSFQQTQNSLIDVLADLHHSKINPLIITPDQLHSQLSIIKNHLPPQLTVPGDKNNLLPLYGFLTVRGRITISRAVFDIRIPLITIEEFEIFKTIPVPAAHWKEFVYIEPSTEFLAVNLLRESYFTLSTEEISKCKPLNEKLLCNQQHPIFNRGSNVSRCELELLTHKKELSEFCKLRSIPPSPVWIQLSSENAWIYVLDHQYTFNLICDNRLYDLVLKDDGILKLDSNCVLKQETMTITSHNVISSELYAAFIPATNISTMLQEKPQNTSIPMKMPPVFLQNGNEDVKTLQKWITAFKNHEKLPAVTASHRTHQTVNYCLIGGLFAGLIIAYILISRQRRLITEPVVELEAITNPVPRPRRFTVSDFTV